MPPAAEYFIGTVDGEPVCHLAVCPFFQSGAYRATRLVVMPEWQGAGVGTRFLEWICQYHKDGRGRCGKKLPTMFHTSHPQLIGFLQNSEKWVLKSQQMFGVNREESRATINATSRGIMAKKMSGGLGSGNSNAGYGGHFRAVQGYKYVGER